MEYFTVPFSSLYFTPINPISKMPRPRYKSNKIIRPCNDENDNIRFFSSINNFSFHNNSSYDKLINRLNKITDRIERYKYIIIHELGSFNPQHESGNESHKTSSTLGNDLARLIGQLTPLNERSPITVNEHRLSLESNNYYISIFDEIKRATPPLDSNERIIALGRTDRKTMANRCIRSVVVTLARHEN